MPAIASLSVVLLLPAIARAEAVATVAGLFNIFVGIMLAMAFIIYVAGMIVWGIRLGAWPSYRDEAIRILQWPVAILFVLIVILGAVQLIQKHLQQAMFVLGVLIVIGVIGLVLVAASGSKEKKDDRH